MKLAEISAAAEKLKWTKAQATFLSDRIRNELTVLSAPIVTQTRIASVRDRMLAMLGAIERTAPRAVGALPLRERVRYAMSDGRLHKLASLRVSCDAPSDKVLKSAFAELARPEHGACVIHRMLDETASRSGNKVYDYRMRTDLVAVGKPTKRGARPVVADKTGQQQLDDGSCTEQRSHRYDDKRKR